MTTAKRSRLQPRTNEIAKQREKRIMRPPWNARKKQLAQLLSELDIMERKAVLDSDSYYSKTDYASDKEGKANLDAEAQQISDKKQSVDELKARVAELQDMVGDSTENESDKTDKSDKTEKKTRHLAKHGRKNQSLQRPVSKKRFDPLESRGFAYTG